MPVESPISKTKLILIALALGSLLAWFFVTRAIYHRHIVILYSHAAIYHEHVMRGIEEAIEKNGDRHLSVEKLSVPNTTDRLAMDALCQKATKTKADCIITVGKQFSRLMAYEAKKRGCQTPIVFVGAGGPVELGLVESLERPGGNVTGIFTGGITSDLVARLLYLVYPNAKSVLLPFTFTEDVSGEMETRINLIKKFLKSKDISVKVLYLESLATALEKTAVLTKDYDVIMTIEDCAFSDAQIPAIAKLVKRENKVLFAGTQEGAEEGAAFTYATQPRYAGQTGFEIVKAIIYQGVAPKDIPVRQLPTSRELIINVESAAKAGITVNLEAVEAAINASPELAVVRDRVRVMTTTDTKSK